jgi:uncharacterized membrane protein
MLQIILFCLLAAVLLMLLYISYHFQALEKKEAAEPSADEAKQETFLARIGLSLGWIYTAIVVTIITALYVIYLLLKGGPFEGHFMEWLNIITRLAHITFGIAWIGASFYFVFLENALNRTENVRDELAGNLWAVHGGGFYYLEKYKVAPKTIPKHLHWFKYEAYFTWVSGFSLLFVVYYFNAQAFLIDKNVLDISPLVGISIGVGSFVLAWVMYDLLCKSPVIKYKIAFACIGTALLVGFAFFYVHVFSARAAFIHFGAMVGSLMVGNVFFVIIPAQKFMVKCAKEGKPLDPTPGKKALARSLHNNYFTLPVLFVMVSNHFPSTFGGQYPWLILSIITLGTAGVKHWLNLREKGQLTIWVLPISVLILLAACFISAPAKPGACNEEISVNEVYAIVQNRCASCHSSKPTDDVFTAAPNGVMYNTPEDISRLREKIMQRVVLTKTMPQNNKTNMTEEERDKIRCWIEQGAKLK